MSSTPSNPKSPELSPDKANQFLEIMKGELNLKVRQVEIREKEISVHENLSKQSITANLEDRKEERKHQRKSFISFAITTIFILLLLLCFFGFCIKQGQTDVVKDIIKYVGLILLSLSSGATGGYLYGHKKGREEAENLKDPS